MTISTVDTIDTTLIQDGQAAGSITPADMRVIVNSLAGTGVTTQTASFTLALTHRGTTIDCNHASVAINVTIPPNASVAFDIGVMITLARIGAAAVAFVAGAGVTFIGLPTLSARAIGSEIYARKQATNVWLVGGDQT